MVSHKSPGFSLFLLLLLWSAASSLTPGRRFIRPSPELMDSPVETASHAVDNPRHQEIKQLQRVYCRGELLHEVQTQELFPDSKHFVDMPIKASSSVEQVLTQFQELEANFSNDNTTGAAADWKARLAVFVDQHFDSPGAELVPTTPPDFHEGEVPVRIMEIRNESLRGWAMELHKLWKVLARVPASAASGEASRSSFLHSLPIAAAPGDPQSALARQFHGENVLVVPGGRFRESYYWDSYWIVQGLLVSGLRQTARGVVNHLLEYVAEFGFVPNGGRIYYLTRSQPPMLSDMVRVVAKLENSSSDEDADAWDLEYLRAAVPLLEREYDFWMHRGVHGHAVEIPGPHGETFVLNRYVAHAGEPRPESYREDVGTASAAFRQNVTTDKAAVYNEIIAAAESGWDFSSRWFADYSTLKTIRTSRVVPVELNSILHRVELNLAKFYEVLGNSVASLRFRDAANTRTRAMDAVLWSESEGCWKDYLLDSANIPEWCPLPTTHRCGESVRRLGLRSIGENCDVFGEVRTGSGGRCPNDDFGHGPAMGRAQRVAASARYHHRRSAGGRHANRADIGKGTCPDVGGSRLRGVAEDRAHVREVQRPATRRGRRWGRVHAAVRLRLVQRRDPVVSYQVPGPIRRRC